MINCLSLSLLTRIGGCFHLCSPVNFILQYVTVYYSYDMTAQIQMITLLIHFSIIFILYLVELFVRVWKLLWYMFLIIFITNVIINQFSVEVLRVYAYNTWIHVLLIEIYYFLQLSGPSFLQQIAKSGKEVLKRLPNTLVSLMATVETHFSQVKKL